MSSDKYADWLTKFEAATILSMSERTLDRLIAKKQVRQAYRRVPGRRPMTVLHPVDIEQLRSITVHPTVLEQPKESSAVPSANAIARVGQMFAQRLPASLMPPADPLSPHRFLSLEEAAAYIGLPAPYLKRLVDRGTLPAIKVRGTGCFLRPRDLDAL